MTMRCDKMTFTNNMSYKNCKSRKVATFTLIVIMGLMNFFLLFSAFINIGLDNSLTQMEVELGADIIAVPYEATTKQEFEGMVLHGQPGNFYMTNAMKDKICSREGIDRSTSQLYFSSFELGNFPFEVQFIGIEKDKDFIISPFVSDNSISDIEDMQVVVGYELRELHIFNITNTATVYEW